MAQTEKKKTFCSIESIAKENEVKTPQLTEIDPDFDSDLEKKEAEQKTTQTLERMGELLYEMYADSTRSLLIILQGIDTSGKDGTIKHIFSGTNPQGIQVHSFKQPSEEELRHDFLWRCHKLCPASGEVAIFNRSYYEEVTTLMVHPEVLKRQHLPSQLMKRKDFFELRYQQINDFERMLSLNGTTIIKFLLHISKKEQKARLEERIKDTSKNWKFSKDDIKERKYWSKYMHSFDQMLQATHTQNAPWHVIPANKKWFRNYLTSEIIKDSLENLHFKFPKMKLRHLKIK
jgi:PPK2 family polyphosphate:nucleotide phosphotransferase